MADSNRYSWKNEGFIIALEMLYEDVVWKQGDTQTDRSKPAYSGHTPVYPVEESFLDIFGQLCRDLRQPDLTRPANATEELGEVPRLTMDYTLRSPKELFDAIDNDGLKRNHALIMGVMLGLNERDCMAFVRKSYEDYRDRFSSVKRQVRWGLGQTLEYAQAKAAWEARMETLTPNFRDVLGQKSVEVPEPVPVPPAVVPMVEKPGRPASSESGQPKRRKIEITPSPKAKMPEVVEVPPV